MSRLPLADRATVRRWIVTTAVANRGAFAMTLACFAAATAVGLVAPRLLGVLLDEVVAGTAANTVDVIALGLLAVLCAEAVLRRYARLRAAMLGEKLLAEAREGFVVSVLRLPLSTVESTTSGDLMSRATSDVDKLDEGLRSAVPEILVATVTIAFTAVAMLVVAPLPALGMLVAVPVLVAAARWYRPRAVRTNDEEFACWADAQATLAETVEGGRVVDALRRSPRRIAANAAVLSRTRRNGRAQARIWGVFCASFEVAYVLPLAAILVLGAWAYEAGVVGLGALATVLIYAQSLSDPLVELLTWVDELMTSTAALRRILGVRAVQQPEAATGREPAGRDIVLRDVHFAYRAGFEALRGVDLHVREGERLAVVGPSGAGKSTLGRLLAGISPPGSGSVALGGVPVTALGTARLRAEIVLLTQEQHVFAATVRDNLAILECTDERMRAALDTVGLGGWLAELPAGLDTVLGAGAHPVSPARAQQLALARLVLADPHTVVLDEATSMLDVDTSRRLDRALAAVLDGRTVIVVAHRLDVARAADRIAVLREGRIVELGSHDELVAAGGDYADLFTLWRAGTRR